MFDRDFLVYESYPGTPSDDNPTGIQYSNIYNNHQEGRRLWLSMSFAF
ncbi:hypothetical protein [Gaopeijia maritima]|uniref:TonB-dependent receptor n=1 Tax=Gaopeijia maritima TaxID=3119007 RepID=A0ABU9E8N6_9BACT